ncbi:MAG: recombinase [Desulfosporosinus sp. BRH_c37]|nr:MAG: recombinase [Desulfosporosinus sp. BRH_c37]
MLLNRAIKSFSKHMELIDRSSETIRGYELELNSFSSFVTVKHNGPVYVEDIGLQDLEDYLAHEKESGIATSSRSRSLYILKSFYNYCCKKDICSKNLASLLEPVKIKQKERAYITETEFDDLVNAIAHPIIQTVVQTMFYTGSRMSETINLKLVDVDLKKKVLHIIEGKGNKDRNVPINEKLHCILTHYLTNIRESESNRFFAIESTGKVSSSYINRFIHDAADKLGWDKDVSAHVLRHSFGTNLLEKGASVVSIQKLLGHSNLAVTSRYLHQDMNKLSDAVNLL